MVDDSSNCEAEVIEEGSQALHRGIGGIVLLLTDVLRVGGGAAQPNPAFA